MKSLRNTLILLFCSLSVMAQQGISLSGTLLNQSDNEPIIAGSVELLTPGDSTFVAGAITKLDGTFAMKDMQKGNYILKATFIGYHPVEKRITLSEEQPEMNVGNIYMQASDVVLSEAVVEGKRPEIVVKNDTIEYDAASYKVTENAVIEDLLKKMPGIEVDKDGKITANGKEIKRFMVDGKEFFTDDPQVASKNLPAEMVEKLQVVDRKSEMARMTGFDDGEEETIINITVKEGMKQGTMGNALLGVGADVEHDGKTRYQAAAFLNHMRNNDRYTLILGTNNNNNMGAADLGANQFGGMRMRRGSGGITETTNFMFSMNKELSSVATLNGDIRYNDSERFSNTKTEQSTLSGNRSQFDKSHYLNTYNSDNLSANFRFEWKPDTMNTLIVRPNLRYNRSKSDEEYLYSDRYDYNTMDAIFSSHSNAQNKGDGISVGGSLDYSRKFEKPGRVFSINFQGNYGDSYSYEDSYWNKKTYLDDPNLFTEDVLNQRSENDDRANSFQGTVSFVEPLGKNFFLQALYKVSYSDSEAVNSTYDIYEGIDPLRIDTAYINPEQSRSTKRHSLDQRFALNVKAVREKFNITLGLNIDPSRSTNRTYQPSDGSVPELYLPYPYDDRLANIMGDSLFSEAKLNVVNFSPIVNFNYIFGQRSNLRLDYEGTTNQPSASQLRDYVDTSNPVEYAQGNPNLKPSYTNRIRAHFGKYVQESQLMYNFHWDLNFTINDITSVTHYLDEGIRLSTYENINGNWNTGLRAMFNMPLRNKRFTISSFARGNYMYRNSYVQADRTSDSEKNTMKNFSIFDNSRINYRSSLFDVGLNLSVNYNAITYTVLPDNNQNTLDYGLGGYTTWYLPFNITIESDINHTWRTGYAAGYNISETVWNAAVTKQLFNKKYGTGSLKLQIYDILQDRNNITSSYTTNGYRTSEVNVIPTYFMCSFIYKFTAFPKSSSATMEDFNPGRGRGGHPGPPPGGRPFF